MYESKNNKIIEEKFVKFEKEVKNERMFLFKLNSLFTDEFEEIIDDILILNDKEFISQLKNRVEKQIEEIYSEKCFTNKKFMNLFEKGFNAIILDYNSDHNLLLDAFNNYSKNKNSKKMNF